MRVLCHVVPGAASCCAVSNRAVLHSEGLGVGAQEYAAQVGARGCVLRAAPSRAGPGCAVLCCTRRPGGARGMQHGLGRGTERRARQGRVRI